MRFMQRNRERQQLIFLAAVIPLLLVSAIAGLAIGSSHVDWTVVVRVVIAKLFPFWWSTEGISKADELIVWLIRVPRVIVAGFVGAGLAMAGALMQGLFRNSLAEPNIVGV